MRTEYKRDMNHSYMVLQGIGQVDTSSYQIRMLAGNVIPKLLKCRLQGVDGKSGLKEGDAVIRDIADHEEGDQVTAKEAAQ